MTTPSLHAWNPEETRHDMYLGPWYLLEDAVPEILLLNGEPWPSLRVRAKLQGQSDRSLNYHLHIFSTMDTHKTEALRPWMTSGRVTGFSGWCSRSIQISPDGERYCDVYTEVYC